ncbi:UNVERIFIED_CONTAM: hypothetical protein GTU68_042001 [Idotea baltica]|nr:hypothetical protein [Idotea baltica]
MVSRLINSYGVSEYHLDTLSSLASGDKLGAFCLTETGAGSDAAALSLKAKKTDSGYVLSGEKIYISSAPHADIFLVFGRTSDEGRNGISCFIVDARTKGIEVGPTEKKMGCAASPIASVRFSNCEIPSNSLLGNENEGYSIALSGLSRGRVSIAAAACGIAASAIEKSKAHLNSRKQFGKAIAQFQGLQFMYADMLMQYRAAVLLTRDAAAQLDSSSNENIPSSMAKCFATDAAMKISTDAVQLLGGAGYLADYGVERLMRDAKMLQIVEGTNQIQRLLIARQLKS